MKRGEITVFLSLVLMLLLSFMVSVIEAARVNTIRFQIECAMDLGMYSALAEYHRELLHQYDLFYIDTSYGGKDGSPAKTQERIHSYLSYNIEPQKDLGGLLLRDLLALEAESVTLLEVSTAVGEGCIGLKSQAVSYMKDKIGIQFIEELIEETAMIKDKNMTAGIGGKRIANRSVIDSYDGKRIEVGENDWKEVKVDNPVRDIPIADSGFLYQVTKNSGGISRKQIAQENYLTQRKVKQSDQVAPGRERADGLVDEILFDEYLLEHCGSYTNPLDKSLLSYQIEYILAGKESDAANLEWVLQRILMLREVANYLYLLSDSGKVSEAKALAASVSAIALVPELAPVLEQAILLGWAYTESINDIKILLEKGRVPMIKDRNSWKLGLSQMLNYNHYLSQGDEEAKGLSYTDYLRLFLLLEGPEKKILHFGDVVEMDIRKTSGNAGFRLDLCIDSMVAQAVVSSRYGYRYDITRRYGYELME